MKFDDDFFFPDTLTIVKKSKLEIPNIRAQIADNGKTLTTRDANFDLDPGDILERVRPTGTKERYIVADATFIAAAGPFSAHYDAEINKIGSLKQSARIVNIGGIGNRYNEHSIDNSVNSVNIAPDEARLFDLMLKTAEKINLKPERIAVVKSIEEMRQTVSDHKSFAAKYNSFVEVAAAHMTLFVPFIPLLTKMLSKN